MLQALKRWLTSEGYPARWYRPVVRIYGGPDGAATRTCMLTRIILSPKTRWGQLYLHIFHREDLDRDPHDHPFEFWTLPLNQGYWEEVFVHSPKHALHAADGCFRMVQVRPWRWSHRSALHTHRITRTETGRWPLVTLVWRGPTIREWGFWCHSPATAVGYPSEGASRDRYLVQWKQYVYGDTGWSNVHGEDVMCPGGVSE